MRRVHGSKERKQLFHARRVGVWRKVAACSDRRVKVARNLRRYVKDVPLRVNRYTARCTQVDVWEGGRPRAAAALRAPQDVAPPAVAVRGKDDVATGSKLTVDLKTNDSVMEGPVRALIVPQQKPATPAPAKPAA